MFNIIKLKKSIINAIEILDTSPNSGDAVEFVVVGGTLFGFAGDCNAPPFTKKHT